jgi:hypothetical protein
MKRKPNQVLQNRRAAAPPPQDQTNEKPLDDRFPGVLAMEEAVHEAIALIDILTDAIVISREGGDRGPDFNRVEDTSAAGTVALADHVKTHLHAAWNNSLNSLDPEKQGRATA